MRRARARHFARRGAVWARRTAIDDDALAAERKLECQAARMRFFGKSRRRRAPGIDNERAPPRFHPLVAGIRRVQQRAAAHVVIGEHSRNQFRLRHAHAVEQGERSVAVAQEPQHRHHAVDGVEQSGRHLRSARRIGLA